MNEDAKARAAARANWPIRKIRVGEKERVVAPEGASPAELMGMVWRLTQDAWAMSGKPMPTYTRAEMPGRIVRAGDRGKA